MDYKDNIEQIDGKIDVINEFYRYLVFWPWFLTSVVIMIISSYFYLRYTEYNYQSSMKIEIMDKAQDSEMALPTAMTIFNRSMINLENEIGVLSSFSIHKQVVENLRSNIKFYTVGKIKATENHHSEWISDYDIFYKTDTDSISESNSFILELDDGKLKINHYDNQDDLVKSYSFKNNSTLNQENDLPFEITIRSIEDFRTNSSYIISFNSFDNVVTSFISSIEINQSGIQSDQLDISLIYPNTKIAKEYLNNLANVFDRDGVIDRQLVYKRTMDFVDSRFDYLTNDLNIIESRKQDFKESNNLTDIKSDASINVEQKFSYNAELFKAISQNDLANVLKETLDESEYNQLMPVNIGIENSDINALILQYNLMLKERDSYLLSAGPNNSIVMNLDKQIRDASRNIYNSIENYQKSLQIKIASLEQKEKEFETIYKDIPENEKILRSIERELEVKESLFLLLLQKREEAAINFAVVKPSIKIIDNARSLPIPVSPKRNNIILGSIILGLFVPFLILFIRFTFDNKIHTKSQLLSLTEDIPIIGEIPYILDNKSIYNIVSSDSRDVLAESIRMITANINFILFGSSKDDSKAKTILVTSSVKGEGKTIVSVNAASVLSSKFKKILLIGADLRNPQIHKFLSVDKNVPGLSDYIYNKNKTHWNKYILKHKNIDVLLSGTIPPNPNQLLSSTKFEEFLNDAKEEYDAIIIDSAPCILVSDTLEISKHVDATVYVIRSNFSELATIDYVNECYTENKLPNISLVLNSVGNSTSYGYKYGYQYGYGYGYKYGYNYGYGYGYGSDES